MAKTITDICNDAWAASARLAELEQSLAERNTRGKVRKSGNTLLSQQISSARALVEQLNRDKVSEVFSFMSAVRMGKLHHLRDRLSGLAPLLASLISADEIRDPIAIEALESGKARMDVLFPPDDLGRPLVEGLVNRIPERLRPPELALDKLEKLASRKRRTPQSRRKTIANVKSALAKLRPCIASLITVDIVQDRLLGSEIGYSTETHSDLFAGRALAKELLDGIPLRLRPPELDLVRVELFAMWMSAWTDSINGIDKVGYKPIAELSMLEAPAR